MNWLAIAEDCLQDEYGSLRRGLLTSVFMLVIGMERVFHLDEMEDPGFALLTGGRRCPSRFVVGAWRRHLDRYQADRFCRETAPWELLTDQDAIVSVDEHTIPRWTHKFSIPKGFVTTRNKYMKCEKLYYSYHVGYDRFVSVRATRGNVELRDVSIPMTRDLLKHGQPRHLDMLFDAGAGKADANVRAVLDFATQTPNLDVTLRAHRHPHRVRLWKSVPAEQFVSHEEAGVCTAAPAKEIRVAETRTTLKGEDDSQAVRTIVCREMVPGPKKDRWHPLYTSSGADPYAVLTTFRLRQHHEQGYRVEVHDEFLNATPCGYRKDSANRRRPRFNSGPLQLIGWLSALVYNAMAVLAATISPNYEGVFVRTIRRKFLNRPGQLYLTPNALIVYLDEFSQQDELIPVIDDFNKQQHRIPWLENRLLVMSLTPSTQPRAAPKL